MIKANEAKTDILAQHHDDDDSDDEKDHHGPTPASQYELDHRKEDGTKPPTVHFDNPFNHEGFKDQGLTNAISNVKIVPIVAGKGGYCVLDDWAVVHYKAYRNSVLVEDS